MKENLRDINQKLEKKNESTRLNSVNSRAEKHFCVYIYIYIYIKVVEYHQKYFRIQRKVRIRTL